MMPPEDCDCDLSLPSSLELGADVGSRLGVFSYFRFCLRIMYLARQTTTESKIIATAASIDHER